ncbi:unnamed protein product [Triticum turgidum subsp. durum]|uniref:G-box binding protein multifunctional mosaic region domain-containing protein n=1 Tax=Triticum turgidum subsp. durum TaxID=4567 RepID=A0A9R0X3A7_TRITD|nr:unnamed protein product [Triticum turgidum subsp. durum]
MGSSEAETPAKANKASAPQEQQPPATSSTATPTVYPDWTSFQGYPPIPPHGFFPSPVVSNPQGHPYMWGPQVRFHVYFIMAVNYSIVLFPYSLSVVLPQKDRAQSL